ncbi:MAG: glycoside hydrolase family 3 protein, partial [Clostridia bacterium]|nr:glycoside hydrolase family 3 protein [Clostridia bacterium]
MRFSRYSYQSVKPLGKGGRLVTASKAHLAVAKKAATDGIVLLKNDGTLPLKKGEKVCLFGRATGEFIFGGGGSGNVLSDVKVSLADALKKADEKGEISLFRPLIEEGEKEFKLEGEKANLLPEKEQRKWRVNRDLGPFPISDKVYKDAVNFGGIALLSILRFSTEASDRKGEAGGFALLPEEKELLSRLEKDFSSVVVILSVCGAMETEAFANSEKVGAILYPLLGGSMAGEAIVDILLGKAYPSGHLQHTLARTIDDYPTTETFLESEDFISYEEDIFVGYRYFSSFCPEKVVYPFGFGLGFTTFEIKTENAFFERGKVTAKVRVTNTGNFKGREVVQTYLSAPQGKLGKAARELCAFQKTKELAPGESQNLTLSFSLSDFASFDDLGKIKESAFVLEKGLYRIYLGNNVRDAKEIFSFSLEKDRVVKKCKAYVSPNKLEKRLLANGKYEVLPKKEKVKMPARTFEGKACENAERMLLEKALKEGRVDEFCCALTPEEGLELVHGHPTAQSSSTGYIGISRRGRSTPGAVIDQTGIPPVGTADGPAGYRAVVHADIKSTFFPCGNTVAQTWDLSLAKKVGAAQALEVKENNAGIYLSPGMNIHRSPLCGRNFEYYSEDP